MKDNPDTDETLAYVPADGSEISAAWLQAVLSDVLPEIRIRNMKSERIGELYGLASQIFRLGWHGIGEVSSVVVKLWDTNSRAGEREVYFYQRFGSVVGTRIPVCYYAAFDQKRNRGVLVLEDLDPVEQGDDLKQLPIERAQLLAESLAAMHAKWMGSHVLEEASWLRAPIPWESESDWFTSRRALFLERFGDRLTQPARYLLNRIEYAPAVSNERLIAVPKTLLHAELHLDNVVFEEDGRPVLLDWAKCAQGPAAIDVYNLLFGISRPQDIKQVLSTYLKRLEYFAGEPFESVDFHHQLGGVFLRMFAIGTCGIARWQPNSQREVAMIGNGIQRTLRALEYWLKHDPELFSFL